MTAFGKLPSAVISVWDLLARNLGTLDGECGRSRGCCGSFGCAGDSGRSGIVTDCHNLRQTLRRLAQRVRPVSAQGYAS
jgi:hypothetical protein